MVENLKHYHRLLLETPDKTSYKNHINTLMFIIGLRLCGVSAIQVPCYRNDNVLE